MNTRQIYLTVITATLLLFIPLGCGDSGSEKPDHQEEKKVITNRIDIPPTVRQNLGITFAKVERRHVEPVIRVPGKFELLPQARREYRATLSGHVELLVEQFQKVKPGRPLYKLTSPQWSKLKQGMIELRSKIDQTKTKYDLAQAAVGEKHLEINLPKRSKPFRVHSMFEAVEKHSSSLKKTINLWEERRMVLEKLNQTGGGRAAELAEVKAQISSLRTNLAKVEEEMTHLFLEKIQLIRTLKNQLESLRHQYDLAMIKAGNLLQKPVEQLAVTSDGPQKTPRWMTINHITFTASQSGVVEHFHVTNGGWAETGERLLSTVNVSKIRFRATGYQSDLGKFKDGLAGRIVPPQGGSFDISDALPGKIHLGPHGDAHRRTIELFLIPEKLTTWSRPGVSAHLEIITTTNKRPVLAVPMAAVVQDRLEMVFFRRDPKDPNKVIRMEADLGVNDGRWIEIKSGVKGGDQVVLEGVYELMLAGSGRAKGGHFHADGTFHAGDD